MSKRRTALPSTPPLAAVGAPSPAPRAAAPHRKLPVSERWDLVLGEAGDERDNRWAA